MKKLNLLLPACVFACLANLQTSRAAAVTYQATGFIKTSDYPADIAVGDRFTLGFSYDDSIRDLDSRREFGQFPGALLWLSLHLIAGQSQGAFAGGFASNGSVGIQPGDFRPFLSSGFSQMNFARIGGYGMDVLWLFLDSYSPANSINDPGGNATLREVLHRPVAFDDFIDKRFEFITAAGKTGAVGTITSMTVVPEPSAFLLAATGAFACCPRRGSPAGATRGRRQKSRTGL